MGEDRFSGLFRGGGIVLLSLGFSLVASFFVKLLLARYLGSVGYGRMVIGISILTMGKTFMLLGLNTGVARYLPRFDDPERIRGVLVSALQIAVPISVVLGVVLVVSADTLSVLVFQDPATSQPIRVFGATIPFAVFVAMFVGTGRGLKETFPKAFSDVFLPLSQLVLVGGSILLGLDLLGVAVMYAAPYVLLSLIGLMYLARHTPLFDSGGFVGMRRELVLFSAPLVVSALSVSMMSNVDVFMMGYFTPTAEVGIYSAMYSLSSLMTAALFAFGYLYLPTLSELHVEENWTEMRNTYSVVTVWVIAVTLPVFLAFVVLPDLVIGVSFGDQYVPGAPALAVLSLGYMVNALAGPNMKTLVSIGETRTIMLNNILVFGLNIALNLVLIPRYSFVGAASATAVSYVTMNLLFSYSLYRAAGLYPMLTTETIKRAIGRS